MIALRKVLEAFLRRPVLRRRRPKRAKLDKEVELEMEAFWKAKADARDWDWSGLAWRSMPLRARRSLRTLAAQRLIGTSCGKALRLRLGLPGQASQLRT